MKPKINLICIFCSPKSGSTLLEILLSSHQLITSIGERRFDFKNCNCEKSLYECNFWTKIRSKLSNKNSFEILANNRDDIKLNREVFQAMMDYSNSNFILESSKNSNFIDKCIKNHDYFDVKVINLIRDPLELVQIQKKKKIINNYKKGANIIKASIFVFFYYFKQLRYSKKAFHITSYDEFVKDPILELNKIYKKLNLDPISNLQIDNSQIHSLGGSFSKTRKYNKIEKSEDLNYLTNIEKFIARILNLPSKLIMKYILYKKNT